MNLDYLGFWLEEEGGGGLLAPSLFCNDLHATDCKIMLGHVHTCSIFSSNLYADFNLSVTHFTSLSEPYAVFEDFLIQDKKLEKS
jgi:hypothetical protein